VEDHRVETSRLPHFPDDGLTDDGNAVSLTRWSRFTPGGFLVLISVRGKVDLKDKVRLKGLGQLKKSNDLIRNRTITDFTAMPAYDIYVGD
jgi:hypothetical protein